MAMRNGDFSGYTDSTGRSYTMYDPYSTGPAPTWQRVPFPNNRIPLSLESPMAVWLNNQTPAPTTTDNPLVAANYFGPSLANGRNYTTTVRMDQRLSDRDQLFGRFSHGPANTEQREGSGPAPPAINGMFNLSYMFNADNSVALSYTHTFSPTLFAETLASYSRENWAFTAGPQFGTPASPISSQNPVDIMGLPNPFGTGKVVASYLCDVGFDFSTDHNGTPVGMYYKTQESRQHITNLFTIDENLIKIIGKHQLLFGGRVRHENVLVYPDGTRLRAWFRSYATSLYDPTSGSAYTPVPYTGADVANFFLGSANQYEAMYSRTNEDLIDGEYAGYFQDNFNVSPRLTLNLGLRYEFHPATKEANGLMTGFDLKTHAIVTERSLAEMYQMGVSNPAFVSQYTNAGVQFESPSQAGLPSDLIYSNPHDFFPRLGFAYRLGSGNRTAIRGGYGVYGFESYTRNITRFERWDPPLGGIMWYDLNSAAQAPDGLPNYGLRSVPTVTAGVNTAHLLDPATTPYQLVTPGETEYEFMNPHQPTMGAHQWNVTLEREIWMNMVVRAVYVGTHGDNIDQTLQLNGVGQSGGFSSPIPYVWFVTTGQPLPTGYYANSAMRPFDKTVYGPINELGRYGWSNANGFRLESEHRY